MQIRLSRYLHLVAFVTVVGLLSTALYFEYVMMLVPCPLCVTQRVVFAILGLVSLAAFFHNPKGKGLRAYAGAVLVFALIGAGLAIRQLYLQSLPPELAPACMPGLNYLAEVLPMNELITIMFSGTGHCAQVQWRFLGLSIPGWTLIIFAGYGLFGVFDWLRHRLGDEQPGA